MEATRNLGYSELLWAGLALVGLLSALGLYRLDRNRKLACRVAG